MKFFISLCTSILLISPSARAHTVDRRAMAQAAYDAFPILLKLVEKTPGFEQELTSAQQTVFRQVLELTKKQYVPLIFNANPADFTLQLGQSKRWMRTPINAPGEVEINLALLNSPETSITLPLLLKTFFHEWANKIDERDLGLRDSVAQFFEQKVEPFVRQIALDKNATLTVLSVPRVIIQDELAEVSIHRPQPTILVLLDQAGQVSDLTELILQSLELPSTLLRSLWAEINRAIYEIFRALGNAIQQATRFHMATAEFQQFNGLIQALGIKSLVPEEIEKAFAFQMKELRTLEIQDIQSVATADGVFVRLKSIYTLSRTGRKAIPIHVTGFDFSDEHPAPITIMLRLPTKTSNAPISPEDVNATLRPETDFMSNAKIQTIHRDSEGFVSHIAIQLQSDRVPENVFLAAAFDRGSRLIRATTIQPLSSGLWRIEFTPVWRFLDRNRPLVAESVLIDSHESVLLDKLVSLGSGSQNGPVTTQPTNSIVENSLGFWGLKDGKRVLFKQFRFQEPIFLIDNLNSSHKSLNPSDLHLEFDLADEEKVREVHFQYRRMAAIVDISLTEQEIAEGREQTKVSVVNWNGRELRFANSGKMVKKIDLQETLTVDQSHIFRTETDSGTQKVKLSFTAPFIPAAEPANSSEVNYPPVIHPILVEIILESGQVLRHNFGERLPESFCEMHLRSKP